MSDQKEQLTPNLLHDARAECLGLVEDLGQCLNLMKEAIHDPINEEAGARAAKAKIVLATLLQQDMRTRSEEVEEMLRRFESCLDWAS